MKYKWSKEKLQEEAFKYNTRSEFQHNSPSAYATSVHKGILDEICSHMPLLVRRAWTKEELRVEALKYTTKNEFQKNNGAAYKAAYRREWLNEICSHMPKNSKIGVHSYNYKWSKEKLQKESTKYITRAEFKQKSSGAFDAALNLGILDEICSHMLKREEKNLLNIIKSQYLSAKKFRDCKVNIPDKPHIKGFELDIYIPELRVGIEYDGTYWHSFNGLRRSRKHWPMKDVIDYHNLKDDYFLTKGIRILHVKERDWLYNKEMCLKQIWNFLSRQ